MAEDTLRAEDQRGRPLAEAYRKAQKAYVLASGLLGAWELLGATLDPKEKWGVELKSPSAVPLILFTLVFYFAYKTTIEWFQCDPVARMHPAAKLDYGVAHLIAVTAVAIALLQYWRRIQVVELVNHWFSKYDSDILFVVSLGALVVIFARTRSLPTHLYRQQLLRLRSEGVARGTEYIALMPLFLKVAEFLCLLTTSVLIGAHVWAHGILHFALSSLVGLCASFVFLLVSHRTDPISRPDGHLRGK